MSRFFSLCASVLALTAPVWAVQKLTYHELRAAKKNVYDFRMVYLQWQDQTPVMRSANWYYRQRTHASWVLARRNMRERLADPVMGRIPTGEQYYYFWKPLLSVQNAGLVSGFFYAHYFDGANHPNSETYPVNVGLVRGKPQLLSITNICKPGKSSAVAANVFSRLRHIPAAVWVNSGMPTLNAKSPELTQCFVITPTGLLFIFDPYVAGPYAAGEIRVKIPFSQLKAELDPNGPLKPVLSKYPG